MQTIQNQTPELNLATEPMHIASDQSEVWHAYGSEPVSYDVAAQQILAAAADDGNRVDLGVGDLSLWAFGPGPNGTASLATIPAPGRPSHMIPLRNHAFGQLCGKVGAPPSYIRKLPGKLQMACVNHGLRQCDESATIRMAGGQARAILSDRYAALDDKLVLEVLEGTLSAAGLMNEVAVRSAAVGRSTVLRITIPGDGAVIGDPEVGDIVEVGLDIVNGEIGNRAVSVTPVTYRLICTNGMRSAHREVSARLRHVGDPKRLEEAFRDAVPAALAASRGLRYRMERAVDHLVDDILSEFSGLRAFGLGAAETRDVARSVMAEKQIALPEKTDDWGDVMSRVTDLSVYDVMNGVTSVAQSKGTERRLLMEEAAGHYLTRKTA